MRWDLIPLAHETTGQPFKFIVRSSKFTHVETKPNLAVSVQIEEMYWTMKTVCWENFISLPFLFTPGFISIYHFSKLKSSLTSKRDYDRETYET